MTSTASGGSVLLALARTMAWPAAATVSLAYAAGGDAVTPHGLALLACGTMAAYGLDRLVDRRDRDPVLVRRALMAAVALAALAAAGLALPDVWRLAVCAALGLIAGLYVPLKRVLPKNLMVTTAWTGAIVTLPFAAFPAFDADLRSAAAAIACMMMADTLISDIPDHEADRRRGFRGITPNFGPKVSAAVACIAALAGCAIAAPNGHVPLAATSLSLAVPAVLLGRDPSRTKLRLVADGLVTVLPAALTWWLR